MILIRIDYYFVLLNSVYIKKSELRNNIFYTQFILTKKKKIMFRTSRESNLEELQTILGYKFNDISILVEALTHSSYANENHTEYNERLEFLGDAVLELIASDYIFRKFQYKKEGELTNIRSRIVCEETQYQIAERLNLGKYMILGRGEDMQGGRYRKSLLGDALEAVIGAIYMDGGFEKASTFVKRELLGHINETFVQSDYKSRLQQITQANYMGHPTYNVIGETGPDHMKTFYVAVYIEGRKYTTGEGSSKKNAEQNAAMKAINILLNHDSD